MEALIKVSDGCEVREENIKGQAETPVVDERRWPSGAKLWPNWILQIVFLPALLWVRLAAIGVSTVVDVYERPALLYVTFNACSSSLNGIPANALSS